MASSTGHCSVIIPRRNRPRLAGQRLDYLVLSMQQFRDKPGPGRDTIMAATLRGLFDAALTQLAHCLTAMP